MKITLNRLLALTTLLLCGVLFATHGLAAMTPCLLMASASCAVLAFPTAFGQGKLGAAPDTTDVAAALNLSEILDSALTSFKRTILPITMFATTFRNVQLRGNDQVEVRYYPLQGITSKDFNGVYNSRLNSSSNTGQSGAGSMTDTRQISVNKRKFQLLEITGYQLARIPMLDARKLGAMKGEKLAYDVISDILSVVTPSNFPNIGLTGANTTFDAASVVDIRTACNNNQTGPNSVTDGVTTNTSTTITSATAQWTLSDIGAPISGTGIPANTYIAGLTNQDNLNGAASSSAILSHAATASGTNITFTMVRPIIPWPKSGRGLIVNSNLDGSLLQDSDFRRDLTVAQSDAIKTGMLPNVYGFDYAETASLPTANNLVGIATYMSAILAAFSPIAPPPSTRQLMTRYEIATDPDTGISIEFREFGDPNSDTDNLIIECNYGYAPGESMAIQRITG